ncbi:uncharacterized protein LOC130649581 [Hydractinia symbiolongicarpus]|uniref:uncharacterized protein LOC130649208 n=1 Tax=Hydractinia symbiolongicarpus TaxID=13093 RepID=UPI002551BDFC|nr:uncharacterized protein LOC130649208 [Hydractinia symbiolongicarpus]XP_057311864.1 uncharacterized protein LOC130649581 [Hydractinia symbiolongicarpus]
MDVVSSDDEIDEDEDVESTERMNSIHDFKLLARWAPAVVNHLYWSIATCKGDGKELAERFVSVVHHTANKHTFPQNSIYKECEHEKLTDEDKRQKEWFQMGSPAHNALIHIVTQKTLVTDLEQMNE